MPLELLSSKSKVSKLLVFSQIIWKKMFVHLSVGYVGSQNTEGMSVGHQSL
jgi:hypothetical protein